MLRLQIVWLGVSGEERIRLLEANTAFTEAHAQAAVAGQSVNPGFDHPPHAYTAFVQATAVPTGDGETHGKRLIELNGGRDGPIDRGASSDLLQVSRVASINSTGPAD